MPLLIAEEINGVIYRNPEAAEIFKRDYAADFYRRWQALQESERQFNANLSADCVASDTQPAFKRGTCAICDAPVQVAETEELPLTCAKAACVARFAQIAQRLGVGS